MISAGKVHVVQMETSQALAVGLKEQSVFEEAEIFLDLGVARVVPINQARADQFAE